jgi:hypothetical protein
MAVHHEPCIVALPIGGDFERGPAAEFYAQRAQRDLFRARSLGPGNATK